MEMFVYVHLHMLLTPCFKLSFAWSAMSDTTTTAAVWVKHREKESEKTLNEKKCQFSPWIIISEMFLCFFSLCRKSPNVKLRMSRGARLCQQAWTGLAPLSEIKDIVSDAGLLMNSTSQFSDTREQKWLSGGLHCPPLRPSLHAKWEQIHLLWTELQTQRLSCEQLCPHGLCCVFKVPWVSSYSLESGERLFR